MEWWVCGFALCAHLTRLHREPFSALHVARADLDESQLAVKLQRTMVGRLKIHLRAHVRDSALACRIEHGRIMEGFYVTAHTED